MDNADPPTCADINSLFNALESASASSNQHDDVIKKLQAIRLWQLTQQEELKKQQQTQLALLRNQFVKEEVQYHFVPDEPKSIESANGCDNVDEMPSEHLSSNKLDTIVEMSVETEPATQALVVESLFNVNKTIVKDNQDGFKENEELDCDVESSFEKVSSQPVCFDDIPLNGAGNKKTFAELLEEQISKEEKTKPGEQTTSSTPKRSFLRKGEGIARFNGPPHKPKKQTLKLNNEEISCRQKTIENETDVDQTLSQCSALNPDACQNLEPLDEDLPELGEQHQPLSNNLCERAKRVVRKTARMKDLVLKPDSYKTTIENQPHSKNDDRMHDSVWSDIADDSVISLNTTGVENLGPVDFEKTSNETFEQMEKYCNLRFGDDDNNETSKLDCMIPQTQTPSAFMQNLFPALKQVKSVKPQSLVSKKIPVANSSLNVTKDDVLGPSSTPNSTSGVETSILKSKLEEMEKEIKRFQEETSKLSSVRLKEEEELASLKNEFETFQKQKANELKQLEEFKKSETKKLKKERKLFEEHANALKSLPSKKDRDYINVLEARISELQEEFKIKEQRLIAVNNRLRTQLDNVNKENLELNITLKNMQQKLDKVEKDCEAQQKKQTSVVWKAINDIVDSTTISDDDTDIENKAHEASVQAKTCKTKQHSITLKRKALTDKNANHVSGNVDPLLQRNGKVERKLQDGSCEICFSNGTQKLISSDGSTVQIKFANGDYKTILADGTVTYVYTVSGTRHITHPNGMQVIEFSNKQVERHFPDGSKHVSFTDGSSKMLKTNGTEETIFPDGTVMIMKPSGIKTIEFSNGQREIHTSEYKRREYPDGTYKTVFQDGRQETRYSSGRLRIKDSNGILLVDRMLSDDTVPIG